MKRKGPLTVFVNCVGGLVDEGFQVADTIRLLDRKVITVAQGRVNSMAVLIFAAGDERHATPLTTFMTHEYSSQYDRQGISQIGIRQENLQLQLKLYAQFMAERTGKTAAFWLERMKPLNHYFDVETAKKYGLVQKVVRGRKKS
ncbi:MAG: hypothetical protein EBQ80_00870 [Proteobacteria bacterium]|nr:hypothetical protein [Pseudomonadota bacterium]